MYGKVDLSQFDCRNKDCPNYGKRGENYVRVKETYGPRQTAFIACRSCNRGYSETKGSPFWHLRATDEQVVAVLTSLSRGAGVRATAEVAGVDQNTVMRLANVAGAHAREMHEHLVKDLKVSQIQADEIHTFVKKRLARRRKKAPP